ncbi:hypothetical protein DFH11DRAFT_15858 [Phellopilus nigrolimitatus]|nr:hypothetical protein DFH11DRAFT_15858 [Phellopilus nigrolimitatus]
MSSLSDLSMSESISPRPSLPTSLSEFALPLSSSSSSTLCSLNSEQSSPQFQTKDDSAPLMKRMRRPTIHLLDSRMNSPLAGSFTIPAPRSFKGKERSTEGENEATEVMEGDFRDKDRITTDSSSPSSESDIQTPPLRLEHSRLDELNERSKSLPMDISRSASPAAALKPSADIQDGPSHSMLFGKRVPYPPKPARLISLRAEAHPEDSEVKSEAQFQRLLASFSGLPPGLGHGRSARAASDRGRYPEEAGGDDEFQREDTPSDDGEDEDETSSLTLFSNKGSNGSDPINITKPSTPVPNIFGTPEDMGGFRNISESPGYVMDVDVPMHPIGSPSLTTSMVPPQQWRQTPPPTTSTSAVRTAKRKYEDRFDPYAPTVQAASCFPFDIPLEERDLVSPIIIPRSPILKPRNHLASPRLTRQLPRRPWHTILPGHLYGGAYALQSAGNGGISRSPQDGFFVFCGLLAHGAGIDGSCEPDTSSNTKTGR